jgi:hypothetical protein
MPTTLSLDFVYRDNVGAVDMKFDSNPKLRRTVAAETAP